MERLDQRGLDVRSLEEASLITSGPAVPAAEVVAAWRRFAADSFARFLSEDVTDLGVGRATEGETTVYTFLGALPEARVFERTIRALGQPEEIRRELLRRVNKARKEANVAPLELDARLTEAAQARADDMAARRYYGHESPEGGDFSEAVRRAGYAYSAVAENIARGQESVAEAVEGWLDSPGHRANLLDPGFTDVGLGFAAGAPGSDHALLWVQLFGRPATPTRSEESEAPSAGRGREGLEGRKGSPALRQGLGAPPPRPKRGGERSPPSKITRFPVSLEPGVTPLPIISLVMRSVRPSPFMSPEAAL